MRTKISPAEWMEQPQQWWQADPQGGEGDPPAEGDPKAEPEPKAEGEPEPEPQPEPEPKVPEADTKGEGDPEPKKADGEGDPEPEPKAAAPKGDWRDKRIDKLTKQLREAQAKQADGKGDQSAEIERLANERAAVLAEGIADQRKFQDECNAATQRGVKAYGEAEFGACMQRLQRLVDPSDKAEIDRWNSFIATAHETGATEHILMTLSNNLDEADRVMGLPPGRQGVALAKLAERKAPEISRAPKPPTSVSNKGKTRIEVDPTDAKSDELPTADWMRRREEQVRQRAAAR